MLLGHLRANSSGVEFLFIPLSIAQRVQATALGSQDRKHLSIHECCSTPQQYRGLRRLDHLCPFDENRLGLSLTWVDRAFTSAHPAWRELQENPFLERTHTELNTPSSRMRARGALNLFLADGTCSSNTAGVLHTNFEVVSLLTRVAAAAVMATWGEPQTLVPECNVHIGKIVITSQPVSMFPPVVRVSLPASVTEKLRLTDDNKWC